MRKVLAALGFLATSAPGHADVAGAFDYYVLALSWSPTWCEIEGAARGSAQCDTDAGFGWIVHGLWPQHARGYPQYCTTRHRDPSRSETAAMADIMGTASLAWYQWQKHGRCAAMDPQAYFEAARDAFDRVVKPEAFRQLDAPVRLPAHAVEDAFLADNPSLFPDAVTITCRDGRIQEARICLTRDDLSPRACGADVIRDCAATDALMPPIP